MANAFEMASYADKAGRQMVLFTFFWKMPYLEGSFRPQLVNNMLPVATIIMTKEDYKAQAKKFLAMLAVQDEQAGSIGPLPK